jgi:hypothetical protein
MAYGWRETVIRGQRALEHSGGQLGFTSYVVLMPERDLGFFIALNQRDGRTLRAIFSDFYSAYYPRSGLSFEPPKAYGGIETRAADYEGWYLGTDMSFGDFQRTRQYLGLAGAWVKVDVIDDNLVMIDGIHYVEIKPGLFEYFNGYPLWYSIGPDPVDGTPLLARGAFSYKKVPFYLNKTIIQFGLLAGLIWSIYLAVVSPLLRKRRARREDRPVISRTTLEKMELIWASIFVMASLLFVAAVPLAIENIIPTDYGMPWLFTLIFFLYSLSIIGATLVVFYGLKNLLARNGAGDKFNSGSIISSLFALTNSLIILHLGLAWIPSVF